VLLGGRLDVLLGVARFSPFGGQLVEGRVMQTFTLRLGADGRVPFRTFGGSFRFIAWVVFHGVASPTRRLSPAGVFFTLGCHAEKLFTRVEVVNRRRNLFRSQSGRLVHPLARFRFLSMPSNTTVEKAKRDLSAGKSASTAAGEFVHEEIDHIREGKHGARSTKQAIAIGLSKARRAGVPLKPPRRGRTSARTQRSATLAYEEGQGRRAPRAPSARRGPAVERALEREGREAASPQALARQARGAAEGRTSGDRSRAAKQAVATKGSRGRSVAAKRAAATRKRNRSSQPQSTTGEPIRR
jgi:hypothetical protein